VFESINITVFYVGSSLIGPLRRAEQEINASGKLSVSISAYNCGAPLTEDDWAEAEARLAESAIVFVIHVTEGENASRIISALKRDLKRHHAVIAFNCMPDLMRLTRLGKLDFATLMKSRTPREKSDRDTVGLARRVGLWMAETLRPARKPTEQRREQDGPKKKPAKRGDQYLDLVLRLPKLLRFVPAAGRLADIKSYLILFCYFLQPTPSNIRSMLLYAIAHYVPGRSKIKFAALESMPTTGIYHPDAARIFDDYSGYRSWYERRLHRTLDPESTLGLLLMRPQIVSGSRAHYDSLIRALEKEGLVVIPAISTFMDNRQACEAFFVEKGKPRVSEVVSLTGFSFVGGPAMNDSEAAVDFLKSLNVPLRSLISLDLQTIENWSGSNLGLNPIQTAMQVSIPEIDGATEPLIFGGLLSAASEPVAIQDRCERIARRLARWHRLRSAPRGEVRVALVLFCFPPDKGNIGTAADLDVFSSLIEILERLKSEGYDIEVPESAEALRELVIGATPDEASTAAGVAYSMSVREYRSLCPFVADVEREWGPPPGTINSNGEEILILGTRLGNAFIAVQPTFGYEGDPMRLLMSESGAPHHGFAALYTYLEKVFRADAVIHVGTHGSLEFMPGKQVGLSSRCWPDRLIGGLPNIYLYSANNPAEGTIAKRRSYAELVSYFTPPVENAGLYKGLASLKDLLNAYRSSRSDEEREKLYEMIEPLASELRLR